MPKFIIERTLPGVGGLETAELRDVARQSNEVLSGMAGRAQWLESYVTDDRLFCIYIADDAGAVLEHARTGGFPCDRVLEVRTIIDPTTAEMAQV